jgi:phosphonopyruvate decarboxylase
MAVGAWMAGRRPVLLMQNSGLGVAVNALASLMLMYQTPALLVISWRGEGGDDAPEHILMGEIMLPLLDLLKIPYRVMRDVDALAADVGWATELLSKERRTVALVAPKGVLQ